MKLLFIVSDFDVGGITESLKNLTSLLVNKGHDVRILNLPKADSLPEGFSDRIKLIDLDKRARLWRLGKDDIKRAGFFGKIRLAVLGVMKKLMNRSEAWYNYVFKRTRLDGYDAVIGFRQSPICYYLALKKSDVKCRCGFWHGDIDYMGDISSWERYIPMLDRIACVSDASRNSLVRRIPAAKAAARTVYNVFDEESICEKASIGDSPYADEDFNIVTVARVSKEKQPHFIPEICKRLLDDGIAIKWHIVGDGPSRQEVEGLINAHGVGDNVILHGNQKNPFPFVTHADLSVLTSATEAYGMVVVESLICGTPVVAGDYPALKEILDGDCGIIAENSADGIYRAVKAVIENKALYCRLKENCESYKYNAEAVYEQFMEMVK